MTRPHTTPEMRINPGHGRSHKPPVAGKETRAMTETTRTINEAVGDAILVHRKASMDLQRILIANGRRGASQAACDDIRADEAANRAAEIERKRAEAELLETALKRAFIRIEELRDKLAEADALRDAAATVSERARMGAAQPPAPEVIDPGLAEGWDRITEAIARYAPAIYKRLDDLDRRLTAIEAVPSIRYGMKKVQSAEGAK